MFVQDFDCKDDGKFTRASSCSCGTEPAEVESKAQVASNNRRKLSTAFASSFSGARAHDIPGEQELK